MRFLILCFLLVSAATQAQHHYTDKPSTHGMMLMGTAQLFASHLPMFHSPHDYQVILRLNLPDSIMEKYRIDRTAHPEETVYTLEPEDFVLPEMVHHTRKFKGNIYRGHFERGGTKVLAAVSFTIAEVVHFKKFENEARSANLQYLLFGNPQEQFLTHHIFSKPDFDEIIQVEIKDKKVLRMLKTNSLLAINFDEADKRKPFSWKNNVGTIDRRFQSVKIYNPKQLYLEFGDLD